MPGSANRRYRIKVLRSSIQSAENKGKSRAELKEILLEEFKDAGKIKPEWDKHKNTRISDVEDALDQEEVLQ